jgi:hypothetical protein
MAERYAGIDWASAEHHVLVADEAGAEVLGARYAHDERGLSALCRMLVRMEVVLVAVERPDGLLVAKQACCVGEPSRSLRSGASRVAAVSG